MSEAEFGDITLQPPHSPDTDVSQADKQAFLDSINQLGENIGTGYREKFNEPVRVWSVLFPSEMEKIQYSDTEIQKLKLVFEKKLPKLNIPTNTDPQDSLSTIKMLSPEVFNELNTDENWGLMTQALRNKLSWESARELAWSIADSALSLQLIRPDSSDQELGKDENFFELMKGEIRTRRGLSRSNYRSEEGQKFLFGMGHVAASARLLFPNKFSELEITTQDIDDLRNYLPENISTRMSHNANMKILTANTAQITENGIELT